MNQLLDPLLQSLNVTWMQIQLFFPRVLGALLLLAAGWLLARFVRSLLVRLLRLLRVDVAAEKAGLEDFLLRGGVRFTTVTLIAQIVYWGLFLVVVLAAFNVLGVPVPASAIEQVASYIPNVLVALIIVIFGSLLAQFARGALQTYLNNIGMEGAASFATLAQIAILTFVATLALSQLRIGGAVLVSAFQIAFGGLCLALALAFGLGGRDWASRILERLGEEPMIVDCHVHLNNYHEDAVETIGACLDELNRAMKLNRVDLALILTSYKVTPGRPSTLRVIEAIRPHPHLAVVAGLDYHTFEARELEPLRPHVREGRVRGLKLYPGYQPFYPGDPKWEPAYAFAAEHGIPVMLHTGDTYAPEGKLMYSHPLHVDAAAVDHRGVNFVICHIGNPWIRDCMEVVYKNANVYTDISGLVLGKFTDRFESYMRKQLQEMLIYGVEPDRVLYGSDWPIASMESYLEFMQQLAAPEREKKRIMGENAIALFGLDPRNSLITGRR